MTTQTINKTTQKYLSIIASKHITERQIIDFKSYLGKNKEDRQLLMDALADSVGLCLDPEQNHKGYIFLLDQWKSPTGKERKNNPFGYREQSILEDFGSFALTGFWNAGNAHVDFFIPIYSCIAKNGNGFEYYYNGKVNIIG